MCAEVSFVVAVLAGGRSTRMGRDKALLVHEGRTLLERQVTQAWGLAPQAVFVVGRAQAELGKLQAVGLPDAQPGLGPLGGLATVLAATQAAHVLLLAVDMPALTAEFLRRLLVRRTPGVGVVPRSEHGWEPTVGLYPRACIGAVEAAVAAGQLGFGRFVDRAVREGWVVAYGVGPEELPLLANWNTPEDLRDAVERGRGA